MRLLVVRFLDERGQKRMALQCAIQCQLQRLLSKGPMEAKPAKELNWKGGRVIFPEKLLRWREGQGKERTRIGPGAVPAA